MIIKIFSQGQLSGSEHINYLFNEKKHVGYKPQLVKGNPAITEMISNNITNKNKYVAGVLSFDKGEILDEQKQQELMSMFESFVAPFDDKARVNFLWVRHFDKGRLELHFMTPRIDLKTNRAYNIHPDVPANTLMYKHLTSMFNYMNGFEPVQPKDKTLPRVTYTESNFKFSVNLLKDLREKRANYILDKYCEKKKSIYNKKTTKKIRSKNGMGTTRKLSKGNSRTSNTNEHSLFNSRRNTKNPVATPRDIDSVIENSRKSEPDSRTEQRASAETVLSLNENDFKLERKTPKQSESRSSTQKANDLRSSPLFTQLQEIMALYESEHNSLKRMELFQRMLELRYQIELQEEAKKLEQEKNKFKFK